MWHVLSQLIPCGGNLTHLTPTWRLWYLFRDCWFGFAWSLAVLRPILGLLKSWAPQYSSISAYQLVYPAWLSLSFKSHICWAPFPEWQDLCSVNRIVPSNEPSAKNRYSNRSTIVLVLIVSSSHCIPFVSPISTPHSRIPSPNGTAGRVPARVGLQRSGRLRQEALLGAHQQRRAAGAHEAAHQHRQGAATYGVFVGGMRVNECYLWSYCV